MKQLKFRRVHFSSDGKFLQFSYWGKIDGGFRGWMNMGHEDSKLAVDEQFTGLFDSEGVEVYEGDIVRVSGDEYHSSESITLDGDWVFVGKVTFDNFIAVESEDKCWITFAEIYCESLKVEIIGNIHEVKNEN